MIMFPVCESLLMYIPLFPSSGGGAPKYRIPLGSQPCGLLHLDKNVVVGCMDNSLTCYTPRVSHQVIYVTR